MSARKSFDQLTRATQNKRVPWLFAPVPAFNPAVLDSQAYRDATRVRPFPVSQNERHALCADSTEKGGNGCTGPGCVVGAGSYRLASPAPIVRGRHVSSTRATRDYLAAYGINPEFASV